MEALVVPRRSRFVYFPILLRFTGLALLLCALAPLTATAISPLDEFQKKLSNLLEHKCLRKYNVGLLVKSLNKADVLFDYNGSKRLVPASNVKIITAAAALQRLHADYTFITQLATDGVKNGRVLQGNLYLIGGGDPSLVPEQLWVLAHKLRRHGIDTVTGDLIYDDAYFDAKPYGEGWDGAIEETYHAPISALSLNFNTVALHVRAADKLRRPALVTLDPESGYIDLVNTVHTGPAGSAPRITITSGRSGKRERLQMSGSVPLGGAPQLYRRAILDAPLYTTMTFREILLLQGTRIVGNAKKGDTPKSHRVLVRHESKTLASIIADLNKFSNNFIAEQIMKNLGAEVFNAPGTTAKGLRAVSRFLMDLGLPAREFSIADGSGLSLHNRLTPRVLVRVLQSMFSDFEVSPEFLSSFGIVGADGLVEKRLQGTAAERNLRVKTGTLAGVASLSGYARSANNEVLAFSFIVNGGPCGYTALRSLQNRLSLLLVKFAR